MLWLELTLVAFFVHNVGVVQVVCEAALDGGHIRLAQNVALGGFFRGQTNGLGLARKLVDALDAFFCRGITPLRC